MAMSSTNLVIVGLLLRLATVEVLGTVEMVSNTAVLSYRNL